MRLASTAGAAVGIVCGCLLGMCTLLLKDLEAAERLKKAKALDTLLRRGGGDGLAPEVLELQPPRVQTFATVGRAGRVATAASDRWGTKRPRGA